MARPLALDERMMALAAAISIDYDYFSQHSHGPGMMPGAHALTKTLCTAAEQKGLARQGCTSCRRTPPASCTCACAECTLLQCVQFN